MKAYKAYDSKSLKSYSTIVFAKNATAAKLAAMSTDTLEDAEYIDIRVVREPKADHLYRGNTEIDWNNMDDRLVLVRDLGWMCWETSWECDTCECKPFCGNWEGAYGS